MQKSVRSLFVCSGLAIALLAGCGQNPQGASPSPEGSSSSASQQEIATFRSPVAREVDEFVQAAADMAAAGDFDTLEKRMAQYRRSREAFLDGREKLQLSYQGMSWTAQNQEQWQKQQRQVESWVGQKPQSVVAQIALALSYAQGALIARRNRMNSPAPEVEDRQVQERSKLAIKALDKVKPSRKQYPDWFYAASMIYRLEQIDRDTYNRSMEEARALFPEWDCLHLNYVTYMMDKSSELGNAWKIYLADAANQAKGKNGDLLTARIVWAVLRGQVPAWDKALSTDYDWPRAKRGFELLMDNPNLETDSVAGAYAKAAWLQKDRVTARELFQHTIKNRADRSVWVGPEEFTAARNWALEK